MHLHLDRQSPQPIYRQLMHEIQQLIKTNALPPGARLPTVRDLAKQLGVTRLTVHTAYSELQSAGWLEATVGKGTFVSARRDQAVHRTSLGSDLSPHGMVNDMLWMAQIPGMRTLAMASAAEEHYPTRDFARAIEEALAHDSQAVLGYTTAQGEPLLRMVLADMMRQRGVTVGPDAVLVTSGVTQALALLARAMAAPGDVVLVEQPTYVGAINLLSRQGLRLVGVPTDSQGVLPDALEAMVRTYNPRFFYCVPAFHNPIGICYTPERRAAVLELAERYNLPVVEDDIYAQIALDRPAPLALKAQDPADLVIYLSSFSKTALPGARVGYVVAHPTLIQRLLVFKQADDLCSPPLLQRAVALFVEHGHYAAHLRRVLPIYRERRDALLDAMARHFPSDTGWTMPEGGFSTWVRLPAHVSVTDLYLAAIDQGVAFAPGTFFFTGEAPGPYMRLSFSAQPPEVLREVTKILGDLLQGQIQRRTYSPAGNRQYLPLV